MKNGVDRIFLTKPSDFINSPLARASLAGIILGLLRALLAKPFFKRLLSWFIGLYCAGGSVGVSVLVI